MINDVDIKWTPQSLSELTPIISNMDLTHFGSEDSENLFKLSNLKFLT